VLYDAWVMTAMDLWMIGGMDIKIGNWISNHMHASSTKDCT
jgi:hypothetical protein